MGIEQLQTLFLPAKIDMDTFHGNQWAMAEITGLDEDGSPLEGTVLAVGTHKEVCKRFFQESDGSRNNFYIFQAGSVTNAGDKFSKNLPLSH